VGQEGKRGSGRERGFFPSRKRKKPSEERERCAVPVAHGAVRMVKTAVHAGKKGCNYLWWGDAERQHFCVSTALLGGGDRIAGSRGAGVAVGRASGKKGEPMTMPTKGGANVRKKKTN